MKALGALARGTGDHDLGLAQLVRGKPLRRRVLRRARLGWRLQHMLGPAMRIAEGGLSGEPVRRIGAKADEAALPRHPLGRLDLVLVVAEDQHRPFGHAAAADIGREVLHDPREIGADAVAAIGLVARAVDGRHHRKEWPAASAASSRHQATERIDALL